MLKKPFKTIATAVAFSPNMKANICESLRIREVLGEKLLLLHVGEHDDTTKDKIRQMMGECETSPGEVEILLKTGDPVDAILEVASKRTVDLIIAGAQPREGLLRYYMGSIARRLVRRANCSVLLMTKPSHLRRDCGRVVVNGLKHPKTPDTVRTAVAVAEGFEARELIIVEEVEPARVGTKVEDDESLHKASEAKVRIEKDEKQRINNILNGIGVPQSVQVSQLCIFGKKGYSIGHFAESTCADLLVMNSPDTKLGFLDRVFTHDLEYILSELPSDLLIVHSQKK